jgi:hypothetical protein
MDSQADLALRETALCYLLCPKNMSRRAHTFAQVHRATTRTHNRTWDTDIINTHTHDGVWMWGWGAANGAYLGRA